MSTINASTYHAMAVPIAHEILVKYAYAQLHTGINNSNTMPLILKLETKYRKTSPAGISEKPQIPIAKLLI
jgi:hypothetical protein